MTIGTKAALGHNIQEGCTDNGWRSLNVFSRDQSHERGVFFFVGEDLQIHRLQRFKGASHRASKTKAKFQVGAIGLETSLRCAHPLGTVLQGHNPIGIQSPIWSHKNQRQALQVRPPQRVLNQHRRKLGGNS